MYWGEDAKSFSDEQWTELLKQVKEIFALARKDGIVIRGGNGTGKPVINDKEIILNGDKKGNLDHETFSFTKKQKKWEFCKTERKPYDAVVSSILYAAQKINPSIKADGDDGKSSIKMGGTNGWKS